MRGAIALLATLIVVCAGYAQQTSAVNGKMFADAIQNQVLTPMSKDDYYRNLDKDAFAKVKPLMAYLRTLELQEDEKVFFVYIERFVKAGDKESDDDDMYKSLALEAIAPLVVKLERRNVKLPEDKVAPFKKWFYDDAMESKLIELRDRYWNGKKTKEEVFDAIVCSPFEKYRIGEKCDVKELGKKYGADSISQTKLAQVNYEYNEVEFKDKNTEVSVGVSPEGKIIQVYARIFCTTEEDQKKKFAVVSDFLKKIYADKLADCGAKESQLLIKIDGYENPRHVLVSCRDSKFDKFVKENIEKAEGKK